jgi:hypothetical protein
MRESAKLIAREIPIHINWIRMNLPVSGSNDRYALFRCAKIALVSEHFITKV